ncbi:hypothetical protein Patl1_31484 [Pistacia atlantica]|uniref:Uncharacterized protein n=1 Tax=Pistacia atlantica TaxID=434234 RepID=A0ACC1ANX4_9ROSI|nr:hypothetical protein Patl1_31484 [Pistacia atlantica]
MEDSDGNILFNVKGVAFSVIHHRRILYDAAGTPIVTIQRKVKSAHDRWQVFRGDSKETSDLIFSVKRSSLFQLKLKLDVILANNTKEDFCDFKLIGGWLERSFAVYAGESSTAVAQMNKTHTGHAFFRKETKNVVVNPNIDYAFIIALIVTLDAIQSSAGTPVAG